MFSVIREKNPKEVAAKVLGDILIQHNDAVLLMVSGGSALSVLECVESESLGSNCVLCVLDERYSNDTKVRNFSQLQETQFYAHCLSKKVEVISIKNAEEATVSDAAQYFEKQLREWRVNNPGGIIVATMGIGPDGHTAGIFQTPQPKIFNLENWVVGYTVPQEVNLYTERITVTNAFLKSQVDFAIVYAVGDEKMRYVQELENGILHATVPAAVLLSMKSVQLFTQK